jgi:hypothetical protein
MVSVAALICAEGWIRQPNPTQRQSLTPRSPAFPQTLHELRTASAHLRALTARECEVALTKTSFFFGQRALRAIAAAGPVAKR